MINVIALFAALLGLLGNAPKEPYIIDGPGMVYVDSDYRTEYANVLPYDEGYEGHTTDYFAVAYLGDADEGKKNRDEYIGRLFGELPKKSLDAIEHYDFGGESMYLVIPRYDQYIDIIPEDGEYEIKKLSNGDAFTVSCGNIRIYMRSHGGQEIILNADSERIISDDCIWDITDLDKLLNN